MNKLEEQDLEDTTATEHYEKLHHDAAESAARSARSMVHDAGNILTAIMGHTDLVSSSGDRVIERLEALLESSPAGQAEGIVGCLAELHAQKEDYTTIIRALHNLNYLFSEYLADSSVVRETPPTGTRIKVYGLSNLVKEVICTYNIDRALQDIKVDVKISPDCEVLAKNPADLHRVIANICYNSLDALEEYGTANPLIQIKGYVNPNGVYLDISDNGPGVPRGMEEKIFTHGMTTKSVLFRGGYGEGLPSALSIMRDLGGDIIYQHGNPGAKFICCFPYPNQKPFK